MRLLITGCHGFIGGAVGRLTDRRGYDVVGVGRRADAPERWPGRYYAATLTSRELTAVLEETKPDAVLHAAGPASVRASLQEPLQDFEDSVASWAATVEAVRLCGSRPLLVFVSSAAVYGNPPTLPVGEDAPVAPISPYGFHKAACELLSESAARCFGLDLLTIRCFSLFGPGLRRLLIRELYDQLVGPAPLVELEGSGEETRDYLSIGDFEYALAALLEQRGRFTGHVVLNVASGVATPVLAVAEELRRILGSSKQVRSLGRARPGDPLHWQADVTRLQTYLPDWRPRPLAAALEECVAAWQEERAGAEVVG